MNKACVPCLLFLLCISIYTGTPASLFSTQRKSCVIFSVQTVRTRCWQLNQIPGRRWDCFLLLWMIRKMMMATFELEDGSWSFGNLDSGCFPFFCCCLLRLFCNKFGAMTWESWVGLLARSFLMQARYSLPLPPSPPAPSVFLDLFLRTLVLLVFPLTKWKWCGALCRKKYTDK